MVRDVEGKLLDEAMDAIRCEAGLDLEVTKEEVRIKDNFVDAIIRITGHDEPIAVEIKKWAVHANIGAIINQVKRLPMDGMLVADYVNAKMADRLRKQDVQFIDTAGNAYINRPPIYVYVKGNRKKDEGPIIKKEGAGRAFSTTGLKVLYAFLCNPALINATYRKIADVADVALGTVGWVLNDLKALRFVVGRGRMRDDRRLVHNRKLLDRWVEAYPEKLRPKQRVGEFTATDHYWWKDVDIWQYQAYWGGEIAAAEYTNRYLKPEVVTLYLPKNTENKFLAAAKLRKAVEWTADGPNTVKIYRPFWRERENIHNYCNQNPVGFVHPILAYADLIATGDARNIEAARMIYEKHIVEYIGED